MVKCCVKGCETEGKNGLHSFPAKKALAEKWIVAIKAFHLQDRLNTNQLSHSFNKLCKKHFNSSDFQLNGKGQTIVKVGCVPSLFLPHDSDERTLTPTSTLRKPVKRLNQGAAVASMQSSKQSVDQQSLENAGDERFGVDFLRENEIGDSEMDSNEDIDVVGLNSEEDIEMLSNAGFDRTCSNRLKATKVTNQSRQRYNLSYYKRRTKDLKLKRNKINDAAVLDYLSTKFNKQLLAFFAMQQTNIGRAKHGRRYTPEQKSLCLAMYKQGPKSYRFKEKWCALPTKRTLGRYSANLIFQSGYDPKIFDAIENVVKDWPQKDRYCSMIWDEVSLEQHLDYSKSQDKIEGFVEMNTQKASIFATHALTFMLRGFEIAFKQPTGYFYTSGLKAFELVELIKVMIERVFATGMIPMLTICDTCSTNATTVNTLVNPNRPSTKQTGDLLQYEVKGHQLIHCFDASHLIKVTRNNFKEKNVVHFIKKRWQADDTELMGSMQIAVWDDLRELYRMDCLSPQRQLLKLTDEHLTPQKYKMRVSHAAQVFSTTCGEIMLEYAKDDISLKHFNGTAELLLFMNDLFDSLNGSEKHDGDTLKSALKPNSIHFKFWDYALTMLSNMYFIDKDTGKRNDRSSVLIKYESTIRGYREIAKKCFEGSITKINVRDTTQDGLKNFFGCVKSCNQNIKSTATQYRTGYTTMIINNITGTNSLQANCQPDQCSTMLTNIHDFITKCKEQSFQPNNASQIPSKFDSLTLFDSENFNTMIAFEPETDLSNEKLYRPLSNICDFSVECNGNDVTESFVEEDINALIVFEPEVEDATNLDNQSLGAKLEMINRDTISRISSRICQDLFKTTKCVECKYNFEMMDQRATLSSIKGILNCLYKIIPDICFEYSLKKKITNLIPSTNIHFIGCAVHNDDITEKIKDLSATQVILTFCYDINKILSGKTKILPQNPNSVQKLAYTERLKKSRIGKYTDIFSEI